MNSVYRLGLFVLLLTLGATAHGQTLFPASRKVQVFDAKDAFIPYPFVGGFLKPQFQTIDINRDGAEDLVVLDAANISGAESIEVFLGNGDAQNPAFVHFPAYRSYLPRHLYFWMRLVDLNGDGRKDLVTNGNIHEDNIRQSFAQNVFFYIDTATGDQPPSFTFLSSRFGASYEPANPNLSLQSLGPPVSQDQPVLTDMDEDGDQDFLFFGVSGMLLNAIYNGSMEAYGHTDSLKLFQKSACWGKFKESAVTASLTPYSCRYSDVPFRNKTLHAGSGMGAIDVDGDGDKDLLLSDTGSETFKLLINGRKELNLDYDSMTTYLDGFPQNGSRQVELPYCPGVFEVDTDFDGDMDLIFSPYEPAGNEELYKTRNQIWHYENTGQGDAPNFQFRSESFLQDKTLDFGLDAKPLFADLDGDGVHELLVAHAGNQYVTRKSSDRLALLRKQTLGDTVRFELEQEDFLGLAQNSLSGVVATAGDLTGDGRIDLLLGLDNGRFRFYENSTTAQGALQFQARNVWLSGLDAGTNAAPTLFDLDEDGDLDLLVGTFDGYIRYYENVGSTQTASFQLRVEELGQIKANPIYNGEAVRYNFLNARPTIEDLNGDGVKELLVGNAYGQVLSYRIQRDSLRAAWPVTRLHYTNPMDTSQRLPIQVGGFATPACGFIDADSLPDLMVGSERGGLCLFSTDYAAPQLTDTGRPLAQETARSFRLYPNPAPGVIRLRPEGQEMLSSEPIQIRVYNLLGAEVWRQRVAGNQQQLRLDLQALPDGVYLLDVHDQKGRTSKPMRFILRR